MNAETTGKLISQLRKEKGLTQKELANSLHVTDKAVSKWERGLNFPELTLMEPLARELDTTVTYLLNLENASHNEVIETITEISDIEKKKILKELQINSYLKICIKIILVFALIAASKILAKNNIYGPGQIFTSGMVGYVGVLIGAEIYTIRKLKSVIK